MGGTSSTAHERAGVKAIEVGSRVLEVLAGAERPLALRDLAAAGHMSPGKAHRYLTSLMASGLARQDPDTRRYALGPLAMRLGFAALNAHQPLRDAINLQRELRNRLDETLVLSVWSTQGPTVIHVDDSSQPVIMTMRVGAVLPMLSTATGLVFAAFLPQHFTEPLITAAMESNHGYKPFTRDRGELARMIEQVRSEGYAYNPGRLMLGVNAAAFPLIDRSSTLVAVTSVMGRSDRINRENGAALIAQIQDTVSQFGR
jgi:DNA-binding IclR family transcriptional regulator